MALERVSILLLTWNSRDLVREAVESALAQSRRADEILVLDNDSRDGTPDLVEALFGSRVRLLSFPRNYGYGGGFNRGLRIAGGEFVLLLNPDVRLRPDFLEQALGAFEDPRVGIVAPRLMRADGRTVDSTGQFLARSRKTVDRGYGEPHDPARDREGPVLSACGAAPLYRRRMIEDISDGAAFFDEDYFAFREDLEVGWRAWRAGWRAVARPRAVATHLRSGGRRAGRLGLAFTRPEQLTAHVIKNRHLSLVRHDHWGALLRDAPWVLSRECAQLAAVAFTRPGVFRRLWGYRALLRRAWSKRRGDARRRGEWGRWRRETPPRGVWRNGRGP